MKIDRTDTPISSLLRIHPKFMRSVHLERDIRDPRSSLGYVPTPVAQQALERIAAGFRRGSTQRAWRVTGDYGSGKTAFGLVLARVAKGNERELPEGLRPLALQDRFLPALVTGDTEPLSVTVLRALGGKSRTSDERPSTEEVVDTVRDAVIKAQKKGFTGLLLILDELGKNLEYAARNPEPDDVFLLQRLAEEAARSADRPFVIVAMLHQGVAAYAVGLESAGRREWDKVAGRFEEIVYALPVEQTAALVAATLDVDTSRLSDQLRRESERSMAAALRAGLYGRSTEFSASDLGPRIFPLHPTVLPVLLRAMRRFGQNERSLFSFISSAEPMGLQDHASHPVDAVNHYRIHHLFDYVRSNLLPTITNGTASTHWGIIDAVLASTPVESIEQEQVLKTVAMLSLLDAPDLPATEEAILLAVGTDRKATGKAIADLRRRGTIYERGSVRGLCLWPHTSVNLDEAFAKGVEASSGAGDGVTLLCDSVQSEHLAPRAYYIQTGTLRYAEVKLIPARALATLLAEQPELTGKGADLNLRVVLPADQAQKRTAMELLSDQASNLSDGLMIGVSEPPGRIVPALTDLLAWEWVWKNTHQLSNDRYAREEVTRQISQARKNLRIRLGGLDNLAVPSATSLVWFTNSTTKTLAPGRQLLAFLGEECSRIYSKTPTIRNELINRRVPSSAAVAARTKLVEAMATAPSKAYVGMDAARRPPEMALYLSILQAGGFHVGTEAGYLFRTPSPDADARGSNLLPAFDVITRTLRAPGSDAMVSVPDVFEALSRPPIGMREGLQPLVLAIYLATHHQRVALYEDGTYLSEVGGNEFLRLTKQPQYFHIQYCEIQGVRTEVLVKLLEVLQLSPRDVGAVDLLDLIRPLVVFVSREVPEYSRKTNRLSAVTVAVRRALFDAREPINLVFTKLPEACGFSPVGDDRFSSSQELALRLRTALHEIRTAYPELIKRLGDALCAAFDVTSGMPAGRRIIADRAQQLVDAVTEPSMKAFALRLLDPVLADRAWIESVANLLTRKSPERWTDKDEIEFHHQLEVAAGRFRRIELVLMAGGRKLNGQACRLALTKSDGTEVSELVNWTGMDGKRIQSIEDEVRELLAAHGRHGLAAAIRAIWHQLESDNEGRKR